MSTQAKHTTGPWHASNSVVIDAADREVCQIHQTPRRGAQDSYDLARLIAAAPELLAALETALHRIEQLELFYRDYEVCVESPQTFRAKADARAAIAKAKGE